MERMRAARLFAPRDLRIVEVERPQPGPDEVLIRVACVAPYGTDLGVYLNRDGRYPQTYPAGICADFSGIVKEVGANVRGFAPGDRVCAGGLAHCGVCANCRKGRTNLCLDPAYNPPPRQVACQEYTLVPVSKLSLLPPNVAFEDAAMLAGLIDALNAHDMLRPQADETVVVIGVGAMGWGAIGAFKALGLRVVAVGGRGRRADLARNLGADIVVPIAAHGESVAARVKEIAPHGVPCVIETTATQWGVQQCFDIAGPGTRIALTGGGAMNVSGWDFVHRELAVFGVRAGHHHDAALDLIDRDKIDLKPSITHRMGLEEAPEAFRLLTSDAAKDVGRVMIQVDAY